MCMCTQADIDVCRACTYTRSTLLGFFSEGAREGGTGLRKPTLAAIGGGSLRSIPFSRAVLDMRLTCSASITRGDSSGGREGTVFDISPALLTRILSPYSSHGRAVMLPPRGVSDLCDEVGLPLVSPKLVKAGVESSIPNTLTGWGGGMSPRSFRTAVSTTTARSSCTVSTSTIFSDRSRMRLLFSVGKRVMKVRSLSFNDSASALLSSTLSSSSTRSSSLPSPLALPSPVGVSPASTHAWPFFVFSFSPCWWRASVRSVCRLRNAFVL
mmetsp:Transcript_43170/g.111917  ORF Transcript_43170/g.111917 Transcript_43170/m.111917 type:complete len:269 (+) Transcript_43170:172-978(+)